MKNISVTTTLEHLIEGDSRLDATYYASDVFQAKRFLEVFELDGNEVLKIGDFSKGTYNPPPIKRIYTDNIQKGTPYMLPQEMFDFYWAPKKYVLAEKMDKIEDWFLKENWVVLTQSGSVGKPYFSTKSDEKTVLSQNAIRIPPTDPEKGGFLYAYLSTWIGQTLLKKDEFGITVKHIRPNQVDEIPIPNIDEDKQKEISKKIKKAFELRKKAIDLINESQAIIYDELKAPHVNIFDEDEDED
jgi:type I restriction enzyme, S subunit